MLHWPNLPTAGFREGVYNLSKFRKLKSNATVDISICSQAYATRCKETYNFWGIFSKHLVHLASLPVMIVLKRTRRVCYFLTYTLKSTKNQSDSLRYQKIFGAAILQKTFQIILNQPFVIKGATLFLVFFYEICHILPWKCFHFYFLNIVSP